MSDSVTITTGSNGIAVLPPGEDLWVFGYGSLMWNPGFAYEERLPARLHGSHRAFCVYSTRYRGTKEVPGVVLGLDRGGSCQGFAFRVRAEKADDVHRYLTSREMINGVYREVLHQLSLWDVRQVRALCYLVRHDHVQYTGKLGQQALLALIRQGNGQAGPCRDYVLNTLQTLEAHGIRDHALSWLKHALRDESAA
jgi:glutathione-specific gamma-glutamylcyclotransferase